jgi:tetratricopeptide (TPR) repeat protein/DNA-binding CsgD family transcriptional regulator
MQSIRVFLVAWTAALWLIGTGVCAAQQGPAAVRASLGRAPADTVRLRLLCQLASHYFDINPDTVIVLAQQVEQLAQHIHQPFWIARATGLYAKAYYDKEDVDRAVGYRRQEIAAWKALGDTDQEYKGWLWLGHLEYVRSAYPQSLECSLKALRYFGRRKNSPDYARALQSIGAVYMDLDEKAKVQHYLKLWENTLIHPGHDRQETIHEYRNLAVFYNWLGNYQLALSNIKKAQRLYKGPYLSAINAQLVLTCADAYYGLRRYSQSRRYATAALVISNRLHLLETGVYSRSFLALSQSHLNQHRLAAASIEQALREAKALSITNVLATTYGSASKIAEKARQFERALAYARRRETLQDSLFSDENKQRANVAQAQHDEYEREQRAVAQRHRLAQQHSAHRIRELTLALLGLGLLAALAGSGLLARQRRLRAERDNTALRARQAELENQQLRAQEALRQSQDALALKNGELTGLALQVNNKEQLVATVREELRAVAPTDEGAAQQLHKLRQSLVLNTHLAAGRDALQQALEQIHPRFFAALQQRCPKVTTNERRLAALLRLNLTTKDLAAVLGISEEGVRKANYRLRRKLGLGADESLAAFLLQLDEDGAGS